jgi:hypothetical protein
LDASLQPENDSATLNSSTRVYHLVSEAEPLGARERFILEPSQDEPALAEIKISVDDQLLKKLEALASERGISREALISKLLADGARAAENEDRRKSRGRMGKADEKIVEDRLKALGYM